MEPEPQPEEKGGGGGNNTGSRARPGSAQPRDQRRASSPRRCPPCPACSPAWLSRRLRAAAAGAAADATAAGGGDPSLCAPPPAPLGFILRRSEGPNRRQPPLAEREATPPPAPRGWGEGAGPRGAFISASGSRRYHGRAEGGEQAERKGERPSLLRQNAPTETFPKTHSNVSSLYSFFTGSQLPLRPLFQPASHRGAPCSEGTGASGASRGWPVAKGLPPRSTRERRGEQSPVAGAAAFV